MNRVHAISQVQFDVRRGAGISIKVDEEGQFHVGILVRKKKNSFSHIHLAFHHDLRCEDRISTRYFWVDPVYSSRRLKYVARYAKLVYDSVGKGMPYGFSSSEQILCPRTGSLVVDEQNIGLTCASFIAAVFESAQVPLVDFVDFPKGNSGDVEWQKGIIVLLRKYQCHPRHIELVENEIGNVRLRPSHVAAACIEGESPSRYPAIVPIAMDIENMIAGEIQPESTS